MESVARLVKKITYFYIFQGIMLLVIAAFLCIGVSAKISSLKLLSLFLLYITPVALTGFASLRTGILMRQLIPRSRKDAIVIAAGVSLLIILIMMKLTLCGFIWLLYNIWIVFYLTRPKVKELFMQQGSFQAK